MEVAQWGKTERQVMPKLRRMKGKCLVHCDVMKGSLVVTKPPVLLPYLQYLPQSLTDCRHSNKHGSPGSKWVHGGVMRA